MKRNLAVAALAALCSLFLATAAPAVEAPTGRELLEHVERLFWGRTLQGEFEMTIVTPNWRRTLGLRIWMERPTRSFVRVLSPAKEAGIGSLRIGSEMWNYLPSIERTIKIPPSMMLQSWMGSDFTNDDLVKESSVINDYTHQVVGLTLVEGEPAYQIEATPKPDAAVVWGRIVYWVRQRDRMPLKEAFYSERGALARVMTFTDIREMDGRTLPTRWEMRPVAKPGNVTVVVLKQATYDRAIDPDIFTQRTLQKP